MAMISDIRWSDPGGAFLSIFENAVEGIFQTLPDGRYIRVNPALAQMYGYETADELMVQLTDIAKQLYVDPDRRADFMAEMEQSDKVSDFESEVFYKDGSTRWISENARAVRDTHGDLLYYEGFVVDITDRKEAEGVRKRLEHELQHTHTMAALGSLSGGIAHDFKTLLAVIDAHTQMIEAKLNRDADISPHIEGIQRVLERSDTLVERIGMFSQSMNTVEPVRVDSIVVDIIRMLHASLPAGIEIRQSIEMDSGTVLADPTDIFRVIINLCTNAFRAMEVDGGVLHVGLSLVDVGRENGNEYSNLSCGKYLRLSLKDTGTGFDASLGDQIFEPSVSTKNDEPVSGLGLAVVKGIVEGLDGSITIKSDPDIGTSVTVLLPAHEQTYTGDTILGRFSNRLQSAFGGSA